MSNAAATTNTHRWTRQQYEQMLETGIFDINDRVELLNGYIIDMSPQTSLHADVVKTNIFYHQSELCYDLHSAPLFAEDQSFFAADSRIIKPEISY